MSKRIRPRRYISPLLLAVARPALRYSYGRDAYVLRLVGDHWGPVLRRDLRGRQRSFDGPDRRGQLVASQQGRAMAGD